MATGVPARMRIESVGASAVADGWSGVETAFTNIVTDAPLVRVWSFSCGEKTSGKTVRPASLAAECGRM